MKHVTLDTMNESNMSHTYLYVLRTRAVNNQDKYVSYEDGKQEGLDALLCALVCCLRS